MDVDANGSKNEEEEFSTGPLSVLMMSAKNNTQVLINCRNNKKSLAVFEPLIATAIWFLRMSERCGLRYPRQGKARKKLFPSTRTGLSARCFSGATPLLNFLDVLYFV